MNMVSKYIRILLAIIILWCCCINSSATSFGCAYAGNASVSFRNNVNLLLSYFNHQSSISRYYNTSVGDNNPDRVHGYYMCRGDVNLRGCNTCILSATQFASEGITCIGYDNGVFYSELCIFGYSNHINYGLNEATVIVEDYASVNVSNYKQFNKTLSSMMEDLINETAFETQNNYGSMLGFATLEADVTSDETIYGLAQCTPDILGVNCSHCLRYLLSSLKSSADRAPAAYASRNKCHLRYDNVTFYNFGTRLVPISSHHLAIYYAVVLLLIMYYTR